ncbi:AmmeMemoRadiSam system radical SAM enzyme [Desulfobotulus sp. H1]|uniref:AmmeMemoRadiSam system radical SAM enzyme n=1 Tax=Desulfobotulus pelophilus TaxID=2823377 RepID=A0ABT3N5G8_9BACT|nr:AmmeMemoRadiSam system radical SAM enzyme [Desulfobotulus pelophilus]MCW7752710.1 AmmeMemoRadiSam system radical SAM enzyme [Desulfobotulus pelophilus]
MTGGAIYSRVLKDGRLQCLVCPHTCILKEGQRGRCFIRMAEGERVILTAYGRSSGCCVDPMEKKPLYHFLPGTAVLSFGTAGCNLSCRFCQNWELSRSRSMERMMVRSSPETIARAALRNGCRSVAYTYNDPVVFLEYAMDTAEACREHGIASVAVTAGYIQGKAREDFFCRMDAANVDLKGFSESFYGKYCGASLKPVLETLDYIRHETSLWLEVTTLVIPGHNDSDAELDALSAWIFEHLGADTPLHFTAFHPDHQFRHVQRTPVTVLQRARKRAMNQGLHYVMTGNVHDPAGSGTYCHHCGHLLIGRAVFCITEWQLSEGGCCCVCGTQCAGIFEKGPGQWGSESLTFRG